MKVAGKIRCSTSKQDLESQRFALIEWAKKNNHTIDLFEEFAVSGKKAIEERKGMKKLDKALGNNEYECLATLEISRLGRNIKDIYNFVDRLSKLGIKIILINSNTTLDYNTLEGKALIGGLALASEIEWCLISERNKRGREKIKRDGIKVGRKRSEDGSISLDAVLLLHQSGKSYRQIAEEMNCSAPTIMRMLRRYNNGQKSNVTNSSREDDAPNQNNTGVTL